MKLKEIMSRNVEAISAEATIAEAAHRMAAQDIGFLPVIDNQGVVGVITDRDIVVRAVAKDEDPKQTSVRDVMTSEVETLLEEQGVEEAARLMEEKQIRRVLVCTADNRYVGVVSLGDLAVGTHDRQLSGEALEKVSEPA